MDAPNPFQPLMDDILRDKIRRARAMSPEERFKAGFDHFEEVVVRMRGGVRAQFPHFSEEEVEVELYRRFARLRQINDHGIYQPLPAIS